ncbi:uncharacterized protein DUF4148 [Paraburkholderia caballeronis]|uniref:DUF4148 domain-containing protein n=1 Tax=Paraburkholderia caballeronis TaxID=416943 RepID=UPI0010E8CA90|nr:DUF4148 domain-containing protein [Paraburkholderia caballeronis]TDV35833.1 uncharacterized protein DUF4148 [Paraburkholderia caballeronis]
MMTRLFAVSPRVVFLARLVFLPLGSMALISTAAAQTATSVTRQQVKAEFVALQQAGYDPVIDDQHDYPEHLQAAEQKLAAARDAARQAAETTSPH